MLYSRNNEFIVYRRDGDTYLSKMVHSGDKSNLKSRIYGNLKYYENEVQPALTFYTPTANGVNSIMTRCPIILNMIAGRGYRKVLFVGYYDEGRMLNWMKKCDDPSFVDAIPFESANLSHVMDFKICYQFLPIIAKEYGYEFEFDVVRPPESRHNGAIAALYDHFEINTVESSKQYKHGSTSTEFNLVDTDYDAVVFMGVPKKYSDTTFTSSEIKEIFADHCVPDFEIFDIYYSEEDKLRYSDRENRKDHSPQIVKAFSTRAEWDREVITGRPAHFQAFERDIRVF